MSLADPTFPDGLRGRPVDRETEPFEEACRLAMCQKAEPGDVFFSRRHGMAACAFVLDQDRPAGEAIQAALLGQIAVAESLLATTPGVDLQLHWPFGICLAGREVARIAIGGLSGQEERDELPDWLVLGIHIHLSSKFLARLSAEDRMRVTALDTENQSVDRTTMLETVATSFARLHEEWEDNGFSALAQTWQRFPSGHLTLDRDGNALIHSGETAERIGLLETAARQQPLQLVA